MKKVNKAYNILYKHVNTLKHDGLSDYIIMGEAIILFNQVGLVIKMNSSTTKEKLPIDYKELAPNLNFGMLSIRSHGVKRLKKANSLESEISSLLMLIF